jgi:hypothetical protein
MLSRLPVSSWPDCEKVAHPEIGDQHADIEGNGTVKRKLRIDDARLVVSHHDGAGMQVAMAQGLGICRENVLEALGLDLEIAVSTQLRHQRIKARCVAIELGVEIGVGENEILSDVAKLGIFGEQGQVCLALFCNHGEVGTAKQRARNEQPEVAADLGKLAPFDERLAQNDMRRQEFHDDDRLGGIKMEDLRRLAGVAGALTHQGIIFEERAFQRQRPGLADQPDIGQRLLDDHRAPRSPDNEYQIEIAVADLGDLPGSHIFSDPRPERAFLSQPDRESLNRQGHELLHPTFLPVGNAPKIRAPTPAMTLVRPAFCQMSMGLTFDDKRQ